MSLTFKQRFKKIVIWFIVVFIFLFLFRLLYGYTKYDPPFAYDNNNDYFTSVDNLRKNYASEKIAKKNYTPQQTPTINAQTQKFEKTASIKSKSSEFEKDEKTIKEKTKNYQGIIQYEQSLGQKGNREIHLSIGINPNKFDSFYLEMQQMGAIKSTQITKIDKTNEYRQLNAKKASIEKTLNSLLELKNKGGQVSDFISLHDKILEIEEKLQDLGVELGNYDSENEFCTVKLSLYEGVSKKSASFFTRIKVAFEWTIKYYTYLLAGVFITLACTFLLVLIFEKLKLATAILRKLNN